MALGIDFLRISQRLPYAVLHWHARFSRGATSFLSLNDMNFLSMNFVVPSIPVALLPLPLISPFISTPPLSLSSLPGVCGTAPMGGGPGLSLLDFFLILHAIVG